MTEVAAASVAPVEYAVAVDRYLAEAQLSTGTRRVYRISLTGWSWPLVGLALPAGARRRQAIPPVVPLAVLDDDAAEGRLADAVAARLRQAEVRTVRREVSALRSAIGWWLHREWIAADPTAGLTEPQRDQLPEARTLTEAEVNAVFRAPASLRDQTLWHLLRDSGAPAESVLRLDAGGLDLRRKRARPGVGAPIEWSAETGDLIGWLLAGRRHGPLFLTDRRAPAGTTAEDVCPLSGRGRLSYRRAAEIFAEHTRSLDPAGRGWMLHQLRCGYRPDPAASSQTV
jgi:integrase